MRAQDLQSPIALGEDSKREFKRDDVRPEQIAKIPMLTLRVTLSLHSNIQTVTVQN